jgi:hypothetical protein
MEEEDQEMQSYTPGSQGNYGSEQEDYKEAAKAGMSFDQFKGLRNQGYSSAQAAELAKGGFYGGGEAAKEYLRQGRVMRGEAGKSKAVRDIEQFGTSMRAQQRGMVAASRDPFAGAARALAERAGAETQIQQQRGVQGQQQAEIAQAIQNRRLLRMQKEQLNLQERIAAENERSLFGEGIGTLLGTLGGIGLTAALPGPMTALGLATGAGVGAQLGGALGGGFISDERMKSNIRDGSADVRKMLDNLSAKKYSKLGEEEVGVMAQDLEKSAEGKKMVEERNGVKVVAPEKGFRQVLTALAEINERMNKLEGKG